MKNPVKTKQASTDDRDSLAWGVFWLKMGLLTSFVVYYNYPNVITSILIGIFVVWSLYETFCLIAWEPYLPSSSKVTIHISIGLNNVPFIQIFDAKYKILKKEFRHPVKVKEVKFGQGTWNTKKGVDFIAIGKKDSFSVTEEEIDSIVIWDYSHESKAERNITSSIVLAQVLNLDCTISELITKIGSILQMTEEATSGNKMGVQ